MTETSPPTVLIADDEPNIVLSLEFLLEQEGYRVAIANTGPQALELIETARPALVLLDVMLPGIDGFEICRRLRARAQGTGGSPPPRIIMLTAKGQDAEKRKGLELGADRYITKPFSTRELMAAVREEIEAG
ncbi:MAG: response regulator [Acidobacteria bacterium]|nr:response regulator [Acidobacteriota bacterium]